LLTTSTLGLEAVALRLAGRAPDELLTQVRFWLAEDRANDAALAIAYAMLAGDIALPPADVRLLTFLRQSESEPPSAFEFSAFGVDERAKKLAAAVPGIDLTAAYGSDDLDEIDVAAIAMVGSGGGATGLWRTWRYPVEQLSAPAARRVYLISVEAPAEDRIALVADLQRALGLAGERDPQVEAFADLTGITAYQRAAFGRSALLWARNQAGGTHMARLFDEVGDDRNGRFTEDHPQVSDEEADRLLDYLDAGFLLAASEDFAGDVIDPERGAVVPLAFRTDGTWVWAEAVAYYLDEYALAPEPDFAEAISAAGYHLPPIDPVAVHRALLFLFTPSAPTQDMPATTSGDRTDG
jgi:hypothetical protein